MKHLREHLSIHPQVPKASRKQGFAILSGPQKKLLEVPLIAFLLLLGIPGVSFGAPTKNHVQVQIVPRTSSYVPAQPLRVALVMDIQKGWHTYWLNPGTAGESARVEWKLPEGWTSRGLEFPVPKRMQEGDLITFGYEDRVVLFDTLVPAPGVAGPVTLKAKVEWLVCKDVCLAEDATVVATLVPAGKAGLPKTFPRIFADWEPRIPRPDPMVKSTFRKRWYGGWRLRVTARPPETEAVFYPLNREGIDFSEVLQAEKIKNEWVFKLKSSSPPPAPGEAIKGIVVAYPPGTPTLISAPMH
jgi:DsbC/DsbD-like thiol-disulfide interchange protein